ncbi:MAG TPA: Mu transposase C-terminal domain-containing protein [Terriglobia bacterium]|jgi:hypothetical protein|nr:Mu transposase C-terminal domain-containing protein [Terriglobia bacterium]
MNDWISVEEVAEYERISTKQVRRRCRMGAQPALVARYEERKSGCPVLRIDPRSMTFEAQQRYREAMLRRIASEADHAKEEKPPASQALFPETPLDQAVCAARAELPPSQFSVAMQRFKIIQPLVNHDFMAVSFDQTGFARKMDYSMAMARAAGVSYRSIRRWRHEFEEVLKSAGPKEAFIALADERPGPERGARTLDASMKAFILDCWINRKLSRRQTYKALCQYLEEKQRGCGARWAYEIPSESTVLRFINAPEPYGLGGDDNPLRGGPEAIKEACGYIDQFYDHEQAGDAWIIDEKEIDGVFYNPARHREIFWSIYVVSVIDERTTKILGWKLAYRLNADTVLDLLEETLRSYFLPKFLVSDRGGHFRGKVLRRTTVRSRGALIDRAIGAMDFFGVEARQPRDKNPRASRIERIHRIYSDLAQRDFGPSWRGRNVEERKMTGIDERAERHLREHCKEGTSGPLLLSTADAERLIARWVEEINLAETDAKGCAGMSRQAAFEAFKPSAEEIARRRVTQAQIDEAFAERDERVIRTGGIIEAADGLRYSSPELIGRAGEKVTFARLRRDRTRIYVEIDGRVVVATHRVPAPKGDAAAAAREAEKLAKIQRLYTRLGGVPTLENAPEHETPEREEPKSVAASVEVAEAIPAVPEPAERLIGFADLE